MMSNNISFIKKTFISALMLGGIIATPTYAIDEDCADKEYVISELALCSTHAYNVNMINNPSNSTEKKTMNDVIAMKTTVITQQMYKQYDMLESMLARFKTQLEKAVLESKLGAAGAKTNEDSGSSYSSSDGYTIISGTMNCRQQLTTGQTNAINCLKNNLNYIITAANSGNTTDARKQLIQDLSAAKDILRQKITNPQTGERGTDYYIDYSNECKENSNEDCCKIVNKESKNKTTIVNCAYAAISKIQQAEEDITRTEKILSQPRMGGWGAY